MRAGQAATERLQASSGNAGLLRLRKEVNGLTRQLGGSAGTIPLEAGERRL